MWPDAQLAPQNFLTQSRKGAKVVIDFSGSSGIQQVDKYTCREGGDSLESGCAMFLCGFAPLREI
jgi:hypothetical protein